MVYDLFKKARALSRAPDVDPLRVIQMQTPPEGLPTYRLLTGADDATFCRRVSEAIALGYKLYGSPSATFNGQCVIVAQALIWPAVESSIAQA
jgi:hypothetical protein